MVAMLSATNGGSLVVEQDEELWQGHRDECKLPGAVYHAFVLLNTYAAVTICLEQGSSCIRCQSPRTGDPPQFAVKRLLHDRCACRGVSNV